MCVCRHIFTVNMWKKAHLYAEIVPIVPPDNCIEMLTTICTKGISQRHFYTSIAKSKIFLG